MGRRPKSECLGLAAAVVLLFWTSCATDGSGGGAQPPPAPGTERSVATESHGAAAWVPSRHERGEPDVDPTPAIREADASMESALERAARAGAGWRPPLPETASIDQILDSERHPEGSVAVGPAGDGRLVEAAKLPLDGDHHEVIERHRTRGTNWGTEELVGLLERAADDVAGAYPGSTLRVGNLARRHGGPIPWSSSHQNGRDADLAFFCRSAETGERVVAPDLVSFGPDGRGRDRSDLRFDVPRNWKLVRSLMTDPNVELQWLFISQSLKQKLLEHARKNDADPKLVERAKEVLHQPTDAPPHDDHLHIRMTCPRSDRLAGCLDWGPRWDWVDWHRDDLLARSLRLLEFVRESDSPERRIEAFEQLERIRSPFAPEVALVALEEEKNRRVRKRALEAAEEIGKWSEAAVAAVGDLLESSDATLEEKKIAYAILRQDHGHRARRVALGRLLDAAVPVDERRYAARALRHRLEPGLVPVLLDELADEAPAVQRELAVVLRRITGFWTETNWLEAPAPKRRAAVAKWNDWWESRRNHPREAWLKRALQKHGAEVDDPDSLEAVDQLIPLLTDAPDHVAYNANRLIHDATERWIPLESWSFRRLEKYWRNWWGDNRNRLLASK